MVAERLYRHANGSVMHGAMSGLDGMSGYDAIPGPDEIPIEMRGPGIRATGAFEGHVVPGVVMLLLSLWWMVNMFLRYYKAMINRSVFVSSLLFPCGRGKCRGYPWVGMIIIVSTGVSCIIDLVEGTHHGSLSSGSQQHITIFVSFMLIGILDVLLYFRVPLPPAITYVAMCLGFTVEYIVLVYHLHGRGPVNTLLHKLLTYVMICCVASVAAEIAYRNSILVCLTRAYFLLLQGTWLLQTAMIIYDPSNGFVSTWNDYDPKNIQLVVLIFAWHIIADFVLMLLVGVVVKHVVKKYCDPAGKLSGTMDYLLTENDAEDGRCE